MPATRRVSPSSRLTPMLMLAATTTGTVAAAAASAALCSAPRPVVPTTRAVRWAAASGALVRTAAGAEKSMTTSDAANSVAASSPAAMPTGCAPASVPRSSPSAGWPGRSIPPASDAASVASTVCNNIRPIRPAQPVIPIRIWSPLWSAFVGTSRAKWRAGQARRKLSASVPPSARPERPAPYSRRSCQSSLTLSKKLWLSGLVLSSVPASANSCSSLRCLSVRLTGVSTTAPTYMSPRAW